MRPMLKKFVVCMLGGLLIACGSALAASIKAQQPTVTWPTAQIQQTMDDRPLIVNTDLVSLIVTVTDADGRYVDGLERSAFSVFDNKAQQEITFFSDEDTPISVGIVFDASRSMSGKKISRAREAVARFIETSHPGNEYFLIAFNSRASLLLDQTHDSAAILNTVAFVQADGRTALYDAESASQQYDRMVLEELSSPSGGRAFVAHNGIEMAEVFERIALELRHQYSIGYRPANLAGDGKWHRIKIKVSPPAGFPRSVVRTREGYYAVSKPVNVREAQ